MTKLEQNLNKHLHGQPLAKNAVLSSLKSHFDISLEKSSHNKALVLSFHGPVGVGKNYAAMFIVDSLFDKGVRSKFFIHFIASRDFSSTKNEQIIDYKVYFLFLF